MVQASDLEEASSAEGQRGKLRENSIEAETPAGAAARRLRVGASVAEYLRPIQAREYSVDELDALFATLASMSAPLCEHLRRDAKRDEEALAAYLRDPAPFLSWGARSKYGAISGCWNFLEMNDQRPDRDFELVQVLFPATEYECASVGAMQPYLMADAMPCRHMTMVDIDWRIHEFHHQVDELASSGRFDTREELPQAVRELRSAWIAERKAATGQALSLRELCPDSMFDTCAQAFAAWGQRVRGSDAASGAPADATQVVPRPGATQLLSSLHDADFDFGPANSRSVLYFSNALEPSYTTGEQTRALLEQLTRKLVDGRRAVIIHHAGGKEAFGLYELWTDEASGKLQIQTLCRDPYPIVSRTVREGVYWIALDRRNAGAPHCTPMHERRVVRGKRGAASSWTP